MITTLFQTIPKGIGYPFVFGVVIFILLFFFDSRIRKTNFFLWIFSFIICVVLSRVFLQINSSRYTAILIFPATIVTAYLCFALKKYPKFFPHKSRSFLCFLPMVLISGITLQSFLVIFRFNPYQEHYMAAYEIIKKAKVEAELAGYDVDLWSLGNHYRRLEYYTGIKPKIFKPDKYEDLLLSFNDYRSVNRYLLIDWMAEKEKKLHLPTSIADKDGKLELLYSSYTNRKKDKIHNVFLYSHNYANINSISSGTEDNLFSKTNLLVNGDLENRMLEEKSLLTLAPYMRETALSFGQTLCFPAGGYFWMNESDVEQAVLFGCDDINPLLDENSIVMASGNKLLFFLFTQRFSSGTYKFSALVKGSFGSEVSLIYDVNSQEIWTIHTVAKAVLSDDNTLYRLSGFFYCAIEDDEYFIVGANVINGNVVLDDFILEKVD